MELLPSAGPGASAGRLPGATAAGEHAQLGGGDAHRPPSRHSATRRRLSDRLSLRHQVEALFGSLPEMLDFQKVFLQTLEERVACCPDLGSLETPGQLQVSAGHTPLAPPTWLTPPTTMLIRLSLCCQALLCSLGGSFLDYADHFKHYSGFCVNHIKVQKVLERGDDP